MSHGDAERQSTSWIPVICLVGLLGYWLLFFGYMPERRGVLWYLLIPDAVLSAWTGGDVRQLSLVDRLPVLFGAGCILAAAFFCGRLSLALIRADRGLTRLERGVFSLGVGLNELSLLTLAVGLAGGLHHSWIFLLLLVLVCIVAAGVWRQGRFADGTPPAGGGHTDPNRGLARWGLWLGLPFLLLVLLGGMLPPWDFDVCEYHLQVPKEWYLQGRVDFLPHNVYGNMPLGAEMQALLAMVFWPGRLGWWWGALVGKTVIACFAPLTAWALLAAGRRFASATAGVVAALIFLSAPWVMHVSISGLIEGALAFYAFLTLYAMMLWWTGSGLESGDRQAGRGRLLLAGFLAGAAVACKYPALLFVLAPALAWCLVGPAAGRRPAESSDPRSDRAARWRAVVAVFLAAVCGCGLWLGKNWVLAGNPVYPLLLGGHTRTVERMEQWSRAHRVPPDQQGRRYGPVQAVEALARVGWQSPWQSAILVPLSVAGLFYLGVSRGADSDSDNPDRRRLAAVCALYAAFFFAAWWLVTHRIDRFWVPVLPALAMLAGVGAAWACRGPWRHVLTGVLVFGLTANFLLVIGRHTHRYLVALDVLREDQPLEAPQPTRVHPAHRYLNAHPPDGRVLLVGGAAPFDLEVPVLYNTCFDPNIFEQLFRGRTRAQRLARLRELGISHVLVNWSEIDRYRSPGNYGFTDYVTRQLVREELVREQGVLQKVPLGADPEAWELFRVTGATGDITP
jgi:hypothetical protein